MLYRRYLEIERQDEFPSCLNCRQNSSRPTSVGKLGTAIRKISRVARKWESDVKEAYYTAPHVVI